MERFEKFNYMQCSSYFTNALAQKITLIFILVVNTQCKNFIFAYCVCVSTCARMRAYTFENDTVTICKSFQIIQNHYMIQFYNFLCNYYISLLISPLIKPFYFKTHICFYPCLCDKA